MIQLIEAPPRSGKSFFTVNYLVGFTKYDDLYNEYILDSDVLIISNIEGLKIKHWDLDYCLKGKTVEEFFNIENFEAIQKKTGKRHIILAIDECHRIFPAGYSNADVYDFFAFHGHLGLDVLLMTQGIQSMSRMFNPLLEFIVKATPRSKKAGKSFTYKYHDLSGKFLYAKFLLCKQLVFGAYSSFRHDEQNKPKSAIMIWCSLLLCVFAFAGFLFWYGISGIKNKGHKVPVSKAATFPLDTKRPLAKVGKPVVLPPVVEVENWQLLYLDGFLEKGDDIWFLVQGRSIKMGARFRNFDALTMSVEYFGPSFDNKSKSPLLRERAFVGMGTPAFAGTSRSPLGGDDPRIDRIDMPPNRQSAPAVIRPRLLGEHTLESSNGG